MRPTVTRCSATSSTSSSAASERGARRSDVVAGEVLVESLRVGLADRFALVLRRTASTPARRQRRRPTAIATAASTIAAAGTIQAARSKPSSAGVARISGPYWSTSWSRICCFVSPRTIRVRMYSRSCSACGDSVASSSETPHASHITSSSMSGSEACGSAARAGTGGASASASARIRAARRTADRERASLRLPISGATSFSRYSSVTGPGWTRATSPSGSTRMFSGTPLDFISLGEVARAVVELRVAEPLLVDELEAVLLVLLGVDAEDDEAVAAVAAIERLDLRRLVLARLAPARPQVDEHPAVAVIADRSGLRGTEPLQ